MASSSGQTGLNEACAPNPDGPDPPEWWCPRYRNRGSLSDFLGDTQPLWVEVVAVRTAQWMNGCRTLDWTYENWLTTILREIGPGIRLGTFVTAFSVVVVASLLLDNPPLLMFPLRFDSIDARWSDATLSVALALWTLDFGALCWAYYDIRHHATPSDMQGNGEWTPFLRVPTLRSREDRAQDGDSLYRTLVRGVAAGFYTLYFFIGVLAMHTLLSHMYRNRNPHLAALLILQCVFTTLASLDDLTHIGSPWGVQECSKLASVTLSVRGLYLVPLTVVWTGCAIAASFPPSYCREC